jgi:hypothetical protein
MALVMAYLLVDARVLDEAVGVSGDQRLPGVGARAAHQPAVAAGGAGAVGGEQRDGTPPEPAQDLLAPELGREAGEEDVRGEPDAERVPGFPAARGEAGPRELRGAARTGREAVVDAVGVRAHPRGRLRVLPLQGREAAPGGVVEAGAPGEDVPGQGGGAEEGGGGALRAVPFHLQLPGAVKGRDPALGAQEREGAVGTQVRYAPGVAVQLGGQGSHPHRFRLGKPNSAWGEGACGVLPERERCRSRKRCGPVSGAVP